MRLFITADLPEDVSGALHDNLADLTAAGIPGRPVAPETLHMTLAFLGERDAKEVGTIEAAMEKTAEEVAAFEVSLGDYGTFGEGCRGVLWQGLSDDAEMSDLANCLAGHLEGALGGSGQSVGGKAGGNRTANGPGNSASARARDGGHSDSPGNGESGGLDDGGNRSEDGCLGDPDAWRRPDGPFVPHVTLARKVDLGTLDLESLEEPWIDSGDVASITLWRSRLSHEGPTYEALRTVALTPAYSHPAGRLLLVDADGCPVTREAIAAARRAGVPVLLVGNGTQNLEKHLRKGDARAPRRGFWAATMNVHGSADSADFQIATTVRAGDVVVTQDTGVAAMALGAGAAAIGVRGREYTKAGIDAALLVRHEEKKVRRQGGRTQGPRAFTDADRERFAGALGRILARPYEKDGASRG